jgi:prepilin peptidase CpaA
VVAVAVGYRDRYPFLTTCCATSRFLIGVRLSAQAGATLVSPRQRKKKVRLAMGDAAVVPWVVTAIAVTVAVITDLRSFRIPNVLTLPLLLSGLAFFSATQGLPGLVASAAGAFVVFLFLLPLYLVGGMGAGDLKLMAGVGAWLKTARSLDVLIVSCLITGLVSMILLWQRRRSQALANVTGNAPLPEGTRSQDNSSPSDVHLRVEDVVHAEDRRTRLVPFGVMIGIGLVVTWARSVSY